MTRIPKCIFSWPLEDDPHFFWKNINVVLDTIFNQQFFEHCISAPACIYWSQIQDFLHPSFVDFDVVLLLLPLLFLFVTVVKHSFGLSLVFPNIFCCWYNLDNYHPLSENRVFSRTEPLLDLRSVCKLKKFFKRSDDEFIFYDPVRFTYAKTN